MFNNVLLPNFVYIDRNVISNCTKFPIPNDNHFGSPKLTFSPHPLKIKEGEPFKATFEVEVLKEIPVDTKIDLWLYLGEKTKLPSWNISVSNI